MKVDWSYHRSGCNTCARADEFLNRHGIEIATRVNAKKVPLTESAALEMAAGVDELYATKGKSVVHLNLKQDQPDAETLKRLLIGPSGKLRAPTLLKGKVMLVGFDEATYTQVLG